MLKSAQRSCLEWLSWELHSQLKKKKFIGLLREFVDIFTWSQVNMSRLDPALAVHNIFVHSDTKPIKQNIWKMDPHATLLVKAELERLLEVGFIRPIDYSN